MQGFIKTMNEQIDFYYGYGDSALEAFPPDL
jgi:hypothetical protein